MDLKNSGGGLGTPPFSNYKALCQTPSYKNTLQLTKSCQKSLPKARTHPSESPTTDRLILEIFVEAHMVGFVDDSEFGFPFCSGPIAQ